MSVWQEQLQDYGWLVEAILYAAGTVALYIFWNKIRHTIGRHTDKTETPWDNIIVRALGAPISIAIVFMGSLQVITTVAVFFTNYQKIANAAGVIPPFIIFITFFWIILRIINGVELRYRRRQVSIGENKLPPGTLYATFQTLRVIIFVVAALTAMDVAGVSISSLLAFGGIGGIIIGIATKDALANFFSGLIIFWERAFVIGDWIRCPDTQVEGVVERIGWRTTQVRTFDQRPLYVPNSFFFNNIIENPQRMTNRRIYEYMGVRYEDIEKMPALLEDIRAMLDKHSGIDQTKIKMINFDRYGASSVDFFIYVMTQTTSWKEYQAVKEDVLLAIAAIVAKHKCEFAYPTRTVHHHLENAKAAAPPPPPM